MATSKQEIIYEIDAHIGDWVEATRIGASVRKEKAKAIGIRKFVMKPFIMREMAKAIRQVLDS